MYCQHQEMPLLSREQLCVAVLYYQVADRGHFRGEMVRRRQVVAVYSSAATALAADRKDLAVGRNIL